MTECMLRITFEIGSKHPTHVLLSLESVSGEGVVFLHVEHGGNNRIFPQVRRDVDFLRRRKRAPK